nr:sporulation integral membrane protein YtvI [Clostridiales bacterium]
YALGIVLPFIIAFAVAMAMQRPVKFLEKKTRISHKFWAILLVILLMLVIFGILVFAGYKIGAEVRGLIKFLANRFGSYSGLISSARERILQLVASLPKGVSSSVNDAVNIFFDRISFVSQDAVTEAETVTAKSQGFDFSLLSTPLSGIWSTAKQIPAIFTAILISIICCVFLAADFDGFVNIVKRTLSEKSEKKLSHAKHVTVDILGKWGKSYAIILSITFVEISLGLTLLSVLKIYNGSYILAIGIATALLDILPVFGTGTVFVPWALICLFNKNIKLAVGLVIIYALISVIRQIIEPRILSTNVDTHPVITLASMYIGIQLFGVFGILILPITIIVLKTLNQEGVIHLWGKLFPVDAELNEAAGTGGDGENKAESERSENAVITAGEKTDEPSGG